jgi:hypothetical protein
MPEAADRALVLVATACRYFSSAEDLWWEATQAAFQQTLDETLERTKAAGLGPQARPDAAVRSYGSAMIDDPVPFRRVTQIA